MVACLRLVVVESCSASVQHAATVRGGRDTFALIPAHIRSMGHLGGGAASCMELVLDACIDRRQAQPAEPDCSQQNSTGPQGLANMQHSTAGQHAASKSAVMLVRYRV